MIKQQQEAQRKEDTNDRPDFDLEVLNKLSPLKIENDQSIPSGKNDVIG